MRITHKLPVTYQINKKNFSIVMICLAYLLPQISRVVLYHQYANERRHHQKKNFIQPLKAENLNF